MRISSVSYVQFPGEGREWRLDRLDLGALNLIVGKNASGKTRAVQILWTLARLLCGEIKPTLQSGEWRVSFEHAGRPVEYTLRIASERVVEEVFESGGSVQLKRGTGGAGRIWASKLGDQFDFQAPQNELATVVRRDQIQHGFLEPLHDWANSVLFYSFGTPLGRDQLGLFVRVDRDLPFNVKDPGSVVGIFYRAKKAHGAKFLDAVIRDMDRLGYRIEEVGLCAPRSVTVSAPTGELMGLFVKESSLPDVTEQLEMSQGMFRALSLLINLNFAELELNPSCVIIDDIGEGLDFARSCALIDLLKEKASEKTQMIMTSNDRFVMNRVPLTSWTVLTREGGLCGVRNYANSKEAFDEFAYTGLNNFEFFATDFLYAHDDDRDNA